MYDLILVDDESFTIDVITDIIDFNSLGFNLAGTFYDGRSALRFIENNHVDAVITDISMPEFSGLELLKSIKKINPAIEVLFLSAYADFEYATFGIDYGIFKYVLKPITIQALSDVLSDLYKHLLSKEKNNIHMTFQNYMNPNLQKAFYDFIYKNNAITADQLQTVLYNSDFSYNLSSDYLTIIDISLIELDSYLTKYNDFNSDTILQAVKNLMCREELLVCPLIYTFDSFKILLITKADNKTDFIKILSNFADSLTCDLSDILNLQAVITLSRIFNDIEDLANYNKVFFTAHRDAEHIIDMIRKNTGRIQILSKLESLILEHKTQSTYMETFAYSVYQMITTYIEPEEMREFNIYSNNINLPIMLDELNVPVQINRLIAELPKTTENLIKYFTSSSEPQLSTIQKAIRYIQQNYSQKISLADVAKHIYCNPTYLSRLLKSTVGLSFTDYLNKLRISQAEELLLKTNDSVYAIAKDVGYNSMGYFYKKFKEKNNCSPDSYRQSAKK